MASALDTSWTSRSIFNHYIFDQENLLKFSIPKDFNTVQRRARREELKVLQVEGKCKYCTHKSRVHFGNPSNWERHLRLHPAHHAEYKASVAPKSKKRARSPTQSAAASQDEPPPKKKTPDQESIVDAMDPQKIQEKKERKNKSKRFSPKKQAGINHKVLRYVVAEALPLDTVSAPTFQEMLTEIDERTDVLCVKTLRKNIAQEFQRYKVAVKNDFGKATCVCLTADIWGSQNRSFIGVTAHWIETGPDGKLRRRSGGIACKRFYGMPLVFLLFKHLHV